MEHTVTAVHEASGEDSGLPGKVTVRPGWLAAAGLLGALATSSCCIVPLALFALGITGAWMGKLTALAPYQPILIAITLGVLLAGTMLVHRRARSACVPGGACARLVAGWLVKGALWAATALVAAALAFPYIVRLTYSG